MPIDDGVNWEGKAGAAGAAYIEVQAASTPTVGVVRVTIAENDTAVVSATLNPAHENHFFS